jgi:hypothetical protein
MFRTTALGELQKDDAQRDAIHIAVAPLKCADEGLLPGQHVGLANINGEEMASGEAEKKIGIVDPFLRDQVHRGQRFLLFLYPNTITSLRHHWSHPAFEGDVAIAKAEIEKIANICGVSYGRIMDAAERYLKYEDCTNMGDDENYKDADFSEFWKHYEIATGTKVDPDKKYCFFSCVC